MTSYKLLIDDNDKFLLSIAKNNYNQLCINNKCIECKYMSLYPKIPIPVTEFDNKICISAKQLKKMYTYLSFKNPMNFLPQQDIIKIVVNENIISFANINTKANLFCNVLREAESEDNDTSLSLHSNTNNKVVIKCKLSDLMCFQNYRKLCNTIDLYIKNDFPLVQVIPLAVLGKMYIFYSAPLKNM